MSLSTPTTVNDEFSFAQLSDTTIANVDWTPVLSTRRVGNSTITGGGPGGVWLISDVFFAELSYTRPNNTITYDFRLLDTVTLEDIILSTPDPVTVEFQIVILGGANETLIKILQPGDTSIVFDIQDFTLDLSNVIQVNITLLSQGDNMSLTIGAIRSTLICVAKDTMVLMADGNEKPIQSIERGDFVIGANKESVYQVARVIHNKFSANTNLTIIKINENAIAPNQPNKTLLITDKHPILHGDVRRQARCFRNWNVKRYGKGSTAKQVLPINDDGTCSLYNLQFEHDGFFVANGVVIDSVPVRSLYYPLPKELYFNQELFDKPNTTVMIPKLCKEILLPKKKQISEHK